MQSSESLPSQHRDPLWQLGGLPPGSVHLRKTTKGEVGKAIVKGAVGQLDQRDALLAQRQLLWLLGFSWAWMQAEDLEMEMDSLKTILNST